MRHTMCSLTTHLALRLPHDRIVAQAQVRRLGANPLISLDDMTPVTDLIYWHFTWRCASLTTAQWPSPRCGVSAPLLYWLAKLGSCTTCVMQGAAPVKVWRHGRKPRRSAGASLQVTHLDCFQQGL